MADEKISAMSAATDVANADVLPIVQGGSNFKATRAQLLTAGGGENITLAGSTGGGFEVKADSGAASFSGDDTGDGGWHFEGNFSGILTDGVNTDSFTGIAGFGYTLTVSPVGQFNIDAAGVGLVNVNAATNTLTIANFGSCNIQFTGVISADWNTDPATLNAAINRLATAVAILQGGPIL